MDEAAGRQATLQHGLVPIGVLGLLIRGKRKGLLPAVKRGLEAAREVAKRAA